MLCKVICGATRGIEVIPVTIEVDVSPGIAFFLVGLPDNAVKESQQRISASLQKLGFKIPGKKIIINLAPANVRKEGSAFDLPIAVGILAASGQLELTGLNRYLIAGELALDGTLRAINGALPLIIYARDTGLEGIILPTASACEGVEIEGIDIYAANTLQEVIEILLSDGRNEQYLVKKRVEREFSGKFISANSQNGLPSLKITESINRTNEYDFKDIKGQQLAKKGLEVAAAGGHNLIMTGSPGSGKTLLAKSITSILPPLSREESIQTSVIYSIAGELNSHMGLIKRRPFRQPHHTSTLQAITGGGSHILPGEISLAHCGVLFLDEFAEFPRSVIEVLRQPLEDRIIQLSRVRSKITYPASFMLIAAMNPCPCGYLDDESGKCNCTSYMIERYRSRVSGPILDRIDIRLKIKPVPKNLLVDDSQAEPSSVIAERVAKAREIQLERFKGEHFFTNAEIPSPLVKRYCRLAESEKKYLMSVIEKMDISARRYNRILKLSRTIADLAGETDIRTAHIMQAFHLSY